MMAIYGDTDVEVYILGDIPSFIIEVYVPDVRKYELGPDHTHLGPIRLQFERKHGVSEIGNLQLQLRNDHHRYSDAFANSIFYNRQVIKDWIRVKCGWGVDWSNDLAVQFQGRMKLLATNEKRQAEIIAYDALEDLLDASVDETAASGLTINAILVPGMNPIDIVEYLIDTHFGIQWFSMDSLTLGDLLDTTSKDAAKQACVHTIINSTTWPNGTRLIEMLQDLMKIVNGYMYGGKDGKLYIYIFAPENLPAAPLTFTGDENVEGHEILRSRKRKDLGEIFNKVEWSYGQSGTKHVSPSDAASIAKYGEKTLSLSTKWECDTTDLDIAASRILAKYAEPPDIYEIRISWLIDGEGLTINLGDVIQITDDAHQISEQYVQVNSMQAMLQDQYTDFIAESADTLLGKFFIFSSEVDEGDGWGVTAGDFAANWLRRFWFFGEAESSDPHFDGAANPGFDSDGNADGDIDPDLAPLDSWDNGIEENFIFF